MSESVDEFLERVSAPRKPLTDQEKKEAMEVASEIRKKAEEIAGGKDKVSLMDIGESSRDLTSHVTIYLGKGIDEFNAHRNLRYEYDQKYPKSDLIIEVRFHQHDEKDKEMRLPIHEYDFTADGVIKTIFDSGITGSEVLKRILERGEDEVLRTAELKTEETYHPDKADLSDLLANLSSAKPA